MDSFVEMGEDNISNPLLRAGSKLAGNFGRVSALDHSPNFFQKPKNSLDDSQPRAVLKYETSGSPQPYSFVVVAGLVLLSLIVRSAGGWSTSTPF